MWIHIHTQDKFNDSSFRWTIPLHPEQKFDGNLIESLLKVIIPIVDSAFKAFNHWKWLTNCWLNNFKIIHAVI